MGINHRGLEILVTKQFLDGPDVISVLKELGRKTMSQRMHGGLFCNPCFAYSSLERLA